MDKSRSLLEVGFEIITKNEVKMSFADLYAAVGKELSMTEEEMNDRIGAFYTDLTLDGRFVALPDNTWDLRSRHTYAKVHIDIASIYSDEEENKDQDAEDLADNRDYEAAINGPILDDQLLPEEDEDGELKDKDGYEDDYQIA